MKHRIRPAELGCGEPYFLSYSARVQTAKPEQAKLLSQWITRYQNTCLALYRLVRRAAQDSRNQLALYAIFLPQRVPEAVQRTWFWAENIKGDPLDIKERFDRPGRRWADPAQPSAKPKVWPDLNVKSTYALLEVFANPKCETPSTRPARVFQCMIAEYGLCSCGLQARSLEWIFRRVPDIETRRRIGESVAGVVRSFLSTRDRVSELRAQRYRVLKELEYEHPSFFSELREYVDDTRIWQEACRCLEDIRKEKRQALREKGFDDEGIRAILWAVQREAMRKTAGKFRSWTPILPATSEEAQQASRNAQLVEEFVSHIGSLDKQHIAAEFSFRRFASRGTPPIRLANEPEHLGKIITAYSKHIAPLPQQLQSLLSERRKLGGRIIHSGWEIISRALGQPGPKDPVAGSAEANTLHNFVTGKVRDWFESLRPVKEAEWPEKPDFWPRFQAGIDWKTNDQAAAPWGNSMNVILRVPGRSKRISVAANLRGHLPPTRAQDVEPLEIASGISRFVADRELSRIARNRPQVTYLKLQSMQLTQVGDRILSKISATQTTQVLRAQSFRGDSASILPGERLAVLHLYPGGRRLAQLVAFERCEAHPGWREIPVEEIITDTRVESYAERDDKRVHVRNQRKRISSFITLDETTYFLRRSRLERSIRGAPPGEPTTSANHGARAALGNIHYRQLAARMASLCRFNRIGYLLIAGTGRLSANIKQEDGKRAIFLTAPAQQFISVRRPGNRVEMHGSLIHALQKSGVTTLFTSARARNFWLKPYLREHKLDGCLPACPYHVDGSANPMRVYSGKRTLISPDDNTPGFAYPRNACWAILMDWSQVDFNKHVSAVLNQGVE